jgi:hypothetical protein
MRVHPWLRKRTNDGRGDCPEFDHFLTCEALGPGVVHVHFMTGTMSIAKQLTTEHGASQIEPLPKTEAGERDIGRPAGARRCNTIGVTVDVSIWGPTSAHHGR